MARGRAPVVEGCGNVERDGSEEAGLYREYSRRANMYVSASGGAGLNRMDTPVSDSSVQKTVNAKTAVSNTNHMFGYAHLVPSLHPSF